MTRYNKTLAALIVSGAIPIIVYLTGATISPEMQAGAVTALTSFFVWAIPNKAI
jgi:hypothetical protein